MTKAKQGLRYKNIDDVIIVHKVYSQVIQHDDGYFQLLYTLFTLPNREIVEPSKIKYKIIGYGVLHKTILFRLLT